MIYKRFNLSSGFYSKTKPLIYHTYIYNFRSAKPKSTAIPHGGQNRIFFGMKEDLNLYKRRLNFIFFSDVVSVLGLISKKRIQLVICKFLHKNLEIDSFRIQFKYKFSCPVKLHFCLIL